MQHRLDPNIDYPATYLGLYCHGNAVNSERAVALMALPNAEMWAVVPEQDGVTLTVRRRDKLTLLERDRADTWEDRHYHALDAAKRARA